MVTQAIMEGGLSTTATAGTDSEQSELLALTVGCRDEECLRSPDSAACILPSDAINGNLLTGTVNETYDGSIKDGSVDLNDDKDHSDIILTINDDPGKSDDSESTESLKALIFQVFIPFLIAGCGTVAAGIVLDIVKVLFFILESIFLTLVMQRHSQVNVKQIGVLSYLHVNVILFCIRYLRSILLNNFAF